MYKLFKLDSSALHKLSRVTIYNDLKVLLTLAKRSDLANSIY